MHKGWERKYLRIVRILKLPSLRLMGAISVSSILMRPACMTVVTTRSVFNGMTHATIRLVRGIGFLFLRCIAAVFQYSIPNIRQNLVIDAGERYIDNCSRDL